MTRPDPQRSIHSRFAAAFLEKGSPSGLQLDGLDGLRGFAVLFVVLGHLGSEKRSIGFGIDFSGAGKYGVYLFFVLSAFLLTRQILRARSQELRRAGHWSAYAARRLLRIFPLYFVVLSVDWIGTRFGSRLVTEMSTTSYLRHLTLNEGKSIYWTIPVEVKYYVALPIVALVLAFCLRRSLAAGLGIGLAAIVASAAWLWPGEAYKLRTLQLGPYLPIFFAGSVSAFIHCWIEKSTGSRRRAARIALEVCAFAAIAAVFAMVPSAWRGLSGLPITLQHFHKDYWLFGLLWAVVVLATVHGAGPLRAIFSAGWIRFIGTVSFSIYLWHVLVLRTVALNLQLDPTFQAWIVIAGALAFAAVSYLAIERPFLRFGARVVREHATRPMLNSTEDR